MNLIANFFQGMNSQFDKIDYAYTNLLDEGYDYLSIMHYDSTAFSKNGQITIEAMIPDYTRQIGKAMELSEGDIRRVL